MDDGSDQVTVSSGFPSPDFTNPVGDGYMYLSRAVQWIATRGNVIEPHSISELDWANRCVELVAAIASERVRAVGINRGSTKPIPSFEFVGCRSPYSMGADQRRSPFC